MDLTRAAEEAGFVAIGFSRAGTPLFYERFLTWIAEGKHAQMAWMARHADLRGDPSRLLEGCRTVISLAFPYSSRKPSTPEGFTVARYTEPSLPDYHHRLRNRAKSLADAIEHRFPGARTRICVDSAPLMERSFAIQAGIGFLGKNTQVIIPGHGSFFFLAEILATAPLPVPEPAPLQDRCGSCTRCLEACPTGALEAPYRLNAGRCLSYQTVEWKGGLDRETGKRMGRCFLGCDVCQEVCPFNRGDGPAEVILPSVEEILAMDPPAFEAAYGKTALFRAGLRKIQTNILAVTALRPAGGFSSCLEDRKF